MYTEFDIAIRVLYATATNTNLNFIEELLTMYHNFSRQKLEELSLAYAFIRNHHHTDFSLNSSIVCDCTPLNENEINYACHLIVNNQERSKFIRMITLSLCISAARQTLKWEELDSLPEVEHRNMLITFVKNASEHSSFNKAGDKYVEWCIRDLSPEWSVSTTPTGEAPHKVITELLFEAANDKVSNILETPVKSHITPVAWGKRSHDVRFLAAVVATIQEQCAGHPRLYINENVLRRPDKHIPAIALFKNFDAGIGDAFGVITHNTVEFNRSWRWPVADCILEWLLACKDLAVPATQDLASLVFDRNTNNPIGHLVA